MKRNGDLLIMRLSLYRWHFFSYVYNVSSTTNIISITVHENSEMPEEITLQAESPRLKKSRSHCFEEVLAILRNNRLSPFDLTIEVLDDSDPRYSYYRTELYKMESKKLGQILDRILSNPAGRKKLDEEIFPHALALIGERITTEMDFVKEAERLPGLNEITPEFIKGWNVLGHQETAPILSRILVTAAESTSAKEKNKKKTPTSVSKSLCRFCFHT